MGLQLFIEVDTVVAIANFTGGNVGPLRSRDPSMTPNTPPVPDGFTLLPTSDGATIRVAKAGWKLLLPAATIFIWDACVFYRDWRMVVTHDHSQAGTMCFLTVAGLVCSYAVIVCLINRTHITVSPSGVRWVSKPLPWIVNKEVGAEDIAMVSVRERIDSSDQRNMTQVTDTVSVSIGAPRYMRRIYTVVYIDRAGRERMFPESYSSPEKADFIAAVIRDVLRLNKG